MSTPHHPQSNCFQSCPLLTSHCLAVSSHVHSSPPTVWLFPVMSIHTTHCLTVSSHVHSTPPTVWLFPVVSTPHLPLSNCFQSCPLLTSHCLAVLLPVMSTPHHPQSSCFQSCPLLTTHSLAVSSHVHSSPPTV